MMRAADKDHLAVVQLLVEKGANLDIKSTNGAWTALMRASSSGQLIVVQYLAERGANLDMQDEVSPYLNLIEFN